MSQAEGAEGFVVGSVPVQGRVFLAPMANFSDSPYRRIVRRHGCALSYSEFVGAGPVARREKRIVSLFRFEEEERPIIFQLFGAKVDDLAEAALVAEEYGADIIDLNMGCSVKDVVQKGAGAGLLRNPGLAGEIIAAMRRNVRVPVTAKIRIGYTRETLNYLETARILEDNGVSMISVHGRTKEDGYTGTADWEAVARVKERAGVPVLGSGDVMSWADARYRLRVYGVDGVLIGRAACGNPWIFSGRDRSDVSFFEVLRVMREHWEMMLGHSGPRAAVLFRKHAVRYLRDDSDARAKHLRSALSSAETPEEVTEAFDYFTATIPE